MHFNTSLENNIKYRISVVFEMCSLVVRNSAHAFTYEMDKKMVSFSNVHATQSPSKTSLSKNVAKVPLPLLVDMKVTAIV